MPHTFRSMIIPAADRDLARAIWGTLDPEYANTFRFACAADGTEITHYCDAGPITSDAALLMPLGVWEQLEDGAWKLVYRDDGNPRRVKWFCENASPPLELTFTTVTGIWDRADVTEQPLNDALARRGLHIVWPEAPEADAEPVTSEPLL